MPLTKRKPKQNAGGRWILLLVGLLLLALGGQRLAVVLAGEKTSATITEVERVVNQNVEKTDHVYRVSYRFRVDGEPYTGSFQKKSYNQAALPSKGGVVGIKYLPAYPGFNARAGETPLTGIVLAGLGAVLFIGGARARRRRPDPERGFDDRPDFHRVADGDFDDDD